MFLLSQLPQANFTIKLALTRYSTPRPAPSLIPEQRRLGASCADSLANALEIRIMINHAHPPPRWHHHRGACLCLPVATPLKAKPSPPLKLSTLRHTAVTAVLFDAVNRHQRLGARLSTLQFKFNRFTRAGMEGVDAHERVCGGKRMGGMEFCFRLVEPPYR
ncbi:hypothetical protein R3P38DRAFT_2802844 [Favolaschia claudopus]|uniref:Uncharacterized protein n=1 Tax=Favolaschia claudopus TaxID=2862362 RepID=A0AAV9ZU98_9AGAR